MSRIRSIHPGIWTDEKFISVTPLAELLFIGLWNFADDGGVFEWNPIVLKAKIFPTRRLILKKLLIELQELGMIECYEVDGKLYGQIKDFGKWQHPKKPVYKYPQNQAKVVCSSSAGSLLVDNRLENDNKINKLQKKVPPVEKSRVEKSKEEYSTPPINPPPNQPIAASEKTQKQKSDPRGTRLPNDWQPNAEERAYAESFELNPDEIAIEFCDYWLAKAGKDARKVDWSRTWMRWVREAKKRQFRGRYHQGQISNHERISQKLDRMGEVIHLHKHAKQAENKQNHSHFDQIADEEAELRRVFGG